MTFEDILSILLLLAFMVGPTLLKLLRRGQQSETPAQSEPDDDDLWPEGEEPWATAESDADDDTGWPWDDDDDDDDGNNDAPWSTDRDDSIAAASAAAPVSSAARDRRTELMGTVDDLLRVAEEIVLTARVDRALSRIAEVISSYVIGNGKELRTRISGASESSLAALHSETSELLQVFTTLRALLAQRRRGELGEALGDADALAQSCYDPIFEFARANRLPLTSAHPVALLTPFDLAIWTGFIPTGLAPLFLPPRFFRDLRWWPAIAHEIAHDFLAATGDTEDRLREALDLPSEELGSRPIIATPAGIEQSEVRRVFGAWFEEIFCDIFATLMLGPAYGYTMIELFADPHEPINVILVNVDSTGFGYGEHPPRHLRLLLCARVLELLGEERAAQDIIREWTEIHGEQEVILYPTTAGLIGLPVDAVMKVAEHIAVSLYRDGQAALSGFSLSSVPGLDYGPHRAAQVRLACDELMAGRVPTRHRAHVVIAAAIHAWRRDRSRHDELLALARRAIVGVTESREDAYSMDRSSEHRVQEMSGDGLREGFLMQVLLAPPPGARRLPGRRRAAGFLDRRTWP